MLAACVEEYEPPVSAAVDVDVVAPQPDASVPVDAGAVPHPAGSLTAGSSTGADAVSEADVSRFRKAVMSLPAGTMATTSQPSPDFSLSLVASEEAS